MEVMKGTIIMKIGRNAPCPCGSGKKYKKCCIDKDKKQKKIEANEDSSSLGSPNISQGKEAYDVKTPRPYVMAKFVEPDSDAAKYFLRQKPHLKKELANLWFPSKIRALSTEKIIKYLAERGIVYNQEAFVKKCQKNSSAWDVSEQLWPKQAKSSSRDIADFSSLAACILWERLYENGELTKLSYEMLDDWIEEGYNYLKKDQLKACKIWIKVWDAFKYLFDLPNQTMDEIDNTFHGSQSFFNWCQDFEMAINNSSIDSNEFHNDGLRYFIEFLEYFSEDNPYISTSMQMGLGELFCQSDNQKKGEQIMQDLIDKYPDKAQGYIGMETALRFRKDNAIDQTYKKQLKVLEAAKSYPVTNGGDYDLDFRIDDLKKKLQNAV